MSARFPVPGLGTVTRDVAGAWVMEGLDGQRRPLPAEFRPILDLLDANQRQMRALEMTASKLSPRVPSLWDGPMPGDVTRSAIWGGTVNATSTQAIKTFESNGNVFVRAIFMANIIAIAGQIPGQDDQSVTIERNGDVLFRMGNILWLSGWLHVWLIAPAGSITFNIVNPTGNNAKIVGAVEAWERIPPVKR